MVVEEAETDYPPDGSPTWVDVKDNYTYSIVAGTGRKLKITPKAGHGLNAGNFYRVRPNDVTSANRLKCAIAGDVNAHYTYDSTTSFFDDHYAFRIYFAFDLNFSGDVDEADVEEWMKSPVDFDGDDTADAVDLALLLDAAAK